METNEKTVRRCVEAYNKGTLEWVDTFYSRDAEWIELPRAGRPQGREGGHSSHRIVHAHGDATGRELALTLDRAARKQERIRLFDHCFVLDLITQDGGTPRCLGAITPCMSPSATGSA